MTQTLEDRTAALALADQDMREGYEDSRTDGRMTLPESLGNRSACYRHGWSVALQDRLQNPDRNAMKARVEIALAYHADIGLPIEEGLTRTLMENSFIAGFGEEIVWAAVKSAMALSLSQSLDLDLALIRVIGTPQSPNLGNRKPKAASRR